MESLRGDPHSVTPVLRINQPPSQFPLILLALLAWPAIAPTFWSVRVSPPVAVGRAEVSVRYRVYCGDSVKRRFGRVMARRASCRGATFRGDDSGSGSDRVTTAIVIELRQGRR